MGINLFSSIIRNNKKQSRIRIVLISICVFLLGVILKNISIYENTRKQTIANISSNNEYRLANSSYLIGSITKYFSDYHKLNALKDFYHSLCNDYKYIYLDKAHQGIYLSEFPKTDVFRLEYEKGEEIEYSNEYYVAKNVTINDNTQKFYDLQVESGRLFEAKDFEKTEYTSIILGHDYTDYYNIGDIINGEYLGIDMKYKVVGILAQDSIMILSNEIVYLDRYIISPSLLLNDTPQTQEELFFQAASYIQKIEGSIVLSDEYTIEEFTVKLESLVNTYGVLDVFVLNESNISLSFFQLTCFTGVNTLLLFAIIIIIIICTFEYCFVYEQSIRLCKFNGIHILNGCSDKKIKLNYLVFNLLNQIIALLFVILLLLGWNMLTVYLGYSVLFIIFFDVVINHIIISKKINQSIDNMMRG